MHVSLLTRFAALTLALALAAPRVAAESSTATERPAQILTSVAPKYPYLMRRAEAPAEVKVAFKVDAKGRVTEARVTENTNPEFIAPTLEAVRQWTFAPALKAGRPVDSEVTQTFKFAVRTEAGTAAAQVALSKAGS